MNSLTTKPVNRQYLIHNNTNNRINNNTNINTNNNELDPMVVFNIGLRDTIRADLLALVSEHINTGSNKEMIKDIMSRLIINSQKSINMDMNHSQFFDSKTQKNVIAKKFNIIYINESTAPENKVMVDAYNIFFKSNFTFSYNNIVKHKKTLEELRKSLIMRSLTLEQQETKNTGISTQNTDLNIADDKGIDRAC